MIEEVRPGIVIVGTAHISATSVREVEETIRGRRPSKVLVELDPQRLAALEDPEAWQKTDIFRVIKEKKQHLFLLQLYLAAEQARMGRDVGVAPGAELLRAIQVADEVGAEVVLIDRDVSVTLKRGFSDMELWARLRLFWKLWMEFLTPAKGEKPLDIESLLQTDAITRMTEEFAKIAPVVKNALIDERDAFMASHIDEQAKSVAPHPAGWESETPTGPVIVAVVGAGHLAGIRRHLADPKGIPDRATLAQPPPPRFTLGKFMAWAIPGAVVALFVYLAFTARWSDLGQSIAWFALITGTCAALGAALALGHPWSILAAFLAAPFATIHPLIASGWFSGLVEAKVRAPTVADFQAVKRIETLGQFWRNGVVRILLVTAITNLGAMVGFWIATGKVLQIVGGG